MFNPDEAKYAQGVQVELPYLTNDTLLLTRMSDQAVDRIFRQGYRYSKAEVMLLDLRQPGEFTGDLFAKRQTAEMDQLMKVVNQINSRWGRGTVRLGRVPLEPEWAMKREMMSQSYTTRLDQLWTVKCN
ncbi:hypothetical protein PS3A_25990 [Pseudomonas sp. 3A(2025)]